MSEARVPILPVRVVVILVAMSTLAAISWLTVASGVPDILTPYSFAVMIPLFFGGTVFAVLCVPTAFLIWSAELISHQRRLPGRSIALYVVVFLASAMWFVTGWSNGLRNQGPALVSTWAAVGLLCALTLALFVVRLHRKPSWWGNVAFHWLVFAWVAWSGFPLLGEGL